MLPNPHEVGDLANARLLLGHLDDGDEELHIIVGVLGRLHCVCVDVDVGVDLDLDVDVDGVERLKG